jgi:hypothetical protein
MAVQWSIGNKPSSHSIVLSSIQPWVVKIAAW